MSTTQKTRNLVTMLGTSHGGYGADVPFRKMFTKCFSAEYLPRLFPETDVVLFEGGTDIDTKFYHQPKGRWTQSPDKNRDRREWATMKECIKLKIPMIGICRGAQLLCVGAGGHLIQDVTGHHGQHFMVTNGGKTLTTSSAHHQMMDYSKLKPSEFELLAWSEKHLSRDYLDGKDSPVKEWYGQPKPDEPEVLWFPKIKALAIQGHPEYMSNEHEFVKYCRSLVEQFIFPEINGTTQPAITTETQSHDV